MSDGESPSHKKLKVDDMEASEEDIKDEVDIIDDMEASEKNIMDEYEERQYYNYTNFEYGRSSQWICEEIPFTEYLKKYEPETKVNKVESFLVLGELCQNLRIYTLLIQNYGESYYIQNDDGEENFDFKVFEIFRGKLKVIQDMCRKKAQESLEKWQRDGNANLVFKNLFTGDWKEAESIGRLEKHESEDKESLNKAYADLSPIYVSLRESLLK